MVFGVSYRVVGEVAVTTNGITTQIKRWIVFGGRHGMQCSPSVTSSAEDLVRKIVPQSGHMLRTGIFQESETVHLTPHEGLSMCGFVC